MTKQQIIEALKNYPDDAEIIIWEWTNTGSKRYYTERTLTNDPEKRPGSFEIYGTFQIKPEA